MSPSSRKRFNAFDDFPAGQDQQGEVPPAPAAPLKQPDKIQEPPAVERIERLKPSQMIPDRFQPRRLLPASLRVAFYSGQISCYQAASEWLSLSHQDNSYRGEIERLLAMGGSFEEHGQIKPITGAWVTATDGSYIFQIETGERRFWAACLRTVLEQLEEELLLRVEVVQKPTRQRQVLENRHAEPPSAVSQACEVASLILAELGILPDANQADDFDYFRLARTQRMPAGLWDRITPIMQLTRPRMVQLLNILQLPTPLLEQADRFRLPERVLREVLALPRPQWERALRLSIQNNLTSDDVAELANQPEEPGREVRPAASPAPDVTRVATGGLRRFANAIIALDEVGQEQALDEIADMLVVSGQAQGILNLLDELAHLVQIRLSRRS